jgi:hypothetical protein
MACFAADSSSSALLVAANSAEISSELNSFWIRAK